MNNVKKIILSLVALILLIVLVGVWSMLWSVNKGSEMNEQLLDESLSADIPEDLYDVAEEEYAIDFAAADQPAIDIDTSFCDLVKEECDKQGVRSCEDYKMCLKGVSSE